MKQYTEKELSQRHDDFLNFVKSNFKGERLEKLLKLYSEEDFGLRLTMAPASGKAHFHCAYAGGYIDHVLNVCKAAAGTKKIFTVMGGVIDFTDEELMFAALHHDLGKLGDDHGEYYVPQESEWHQKNKGEIYKHNPAIQFMGVTDRALYILQNRGIAVTQKEWLGIKLSDGIYDEGNKSYLISYNPDFSLRTSLPHVLHWADHISCQAEYTAWKSGH